MKRRYFILSVLCLLLFAGIFTGAAAAATELITNGNFSDGLNGWDKDITDPYDSTANITASGNSAYFTLVSSSRSGDNTYASISQTIDVTNAETLTFKTKQNTASYADHYWGHTCLRILKDGVLVMTYNFNELGSSTWTEESISVASLTGEVTLSFEGWVAPGGPSFTTVQSCSFYITDISCMDLTTQPVINSAEFAGHTGESGIGVSKGDTVTVSYTATAGYPLGTYVWVNWGDGLVSNTSFAGTSDTNTFTHTYSAVGDYDVSIKAERMTGTVFQDWVPIGTVKVIDMDFTAEPRAADPNSYVQFVANISSFTEIASYAWNFGDGTTGYGASAVHQYTAAGTYSPVLTITTVDGYVISKTKTNYVLIAAQSVSFANTEVTAGDTVQINWSLRNPDYSTPYILRVYPSSNTGEPISTTAVATHNITSSSQTSYMWTTGTGGYFTAIITQNNYEVARSATPLNAIVYVSLTVNVYDDQVPFTAEQTTVKLYQEGGAAPYSTKTTAANQYSVVWTDIPSGNYYVKISSATKTEKTSPTLALTDSYVLNIDFTRGSSEGGNGAGVGGQYATSFVTFRCQDSGTGKYLPNVHIVAQAVEPTNAWEYFVNLFGASIGNVIQAMTLSGDSDYNGVITFAMYQNVRYKLTISYNQQGITYSEERSFQMSSLSGEYLIALPITDHSAASAAENLITMVETSGTDSIIAKFTDKSGTVSSVNVSIFEFDDDGGRVPVTVEPWNLTNPPMNTEQEHTFTIPDGSGRSYYVSFEITSSKFGTVTKEYGVTFSGPRIKIGNLPDEFYIWICFGILIMLGAVATFVNSRMFAFVIPLVASFFLFAGWLFALGPAGPIAVVICFVLAIVYYIAGSGGPV